MTGSNNDISTEVEKYLQCIMINLLLKMVFSVLCISLAFTAYSFVSMKYLEVINVLSVCNVDKLP